MSHEAILESLLFVVGEEGLSLEDITNILEIDPLPILENLQKRYSDSIYGLDVVLLGNRYKMVTKKEVKPYLQKLVDIDNSEPLSVSALETLAIVAYNQPVTRLMVDEIRGIGSSHMIRKLVYKNLICEVGRSESAGRPILYGTTDLFLDYFGLKSIDELPVIEKVEDLDIETDLYNSKYTEEIMDIDEE